MDNSTDARRTEELKLKSRLNQQACTVFNELRQNNQLCDAVLVCQGVEFPVHKIIMSACSPYFRALFNNWSVEASKKTIEVTGIAPEMMRIIVDFAYGREAAITSDNIEQLLPVADQFHVMGLIKACCLYLQTNLSVENCIGIRDFARHHFCTNLESVAENYLKKKFSRVAKHSQEILLLSIEDFCEVLSADDLNVKDEEVVFETAIRWIDHDPENRKQHIVRLLRTVRLGLLNTNYFLEKVKKNIYVAENSECRPIVKDTLKFLYDLDLHYDNDVDLSNPLTRPRIPNEVLFAIGGWSGGSPTKAVEAYDVRADRWTLVPESYEDTDPRAYHACVTVGQKVFVIGGFDGVSYFNSVRSFDPVTKEWCEKAPMHCKRCYISAVVLGDVVFAMGGFDGHIRQNTAERYDVRSNQWSFIAPMHFQRSDASATVLNDHVYIVGGFNGQECLSSAECYDPLTNQWTMIAPMRNRRSGIGIIAYHNNIYAVGGFNGIVRMNSGEKYDPVTNLWKPICEMLSPRSNFAIEVIDDMIFAIGGFNGITTIYNVECYDDSTNDWYDATDMNIFRSALSACVVSNLPNVRDYLNKDRDRSPHSDAANRVDHAEEASEQPAGQQAIHGPQAGPSQH